MKIASNGTPIPIPARLNLVIAVVSFSLALVFLLGATYAETWWQGLFAAGFALVGNTIFSLLHESVHRVFHPNKTVNDLFGQFCAMFFPTGFFFQRAFHLGHHRRNRTDVEMFDMYYPNDSKFLKFTQMYTILLGFYWTAAPIGGILYLISPRMLDFKLFRSKNKYLKPMSMEAMISGLDGLNSKRVRLELLVSLLFQISLFFVLGISFRAWLCCYWSFAILWGSIQYADHAWSKRDIRSGAWNLRVNWFVEKVFLNYHHHLAHHEYPYVPWIHLPKFVDYSAYRPSHFGIWLSLWKGPRPANAPAPKPISDEFKKLIGD